MADEALNRIIVTRRSSDYHACLACHPEVWGAGKSRYEAVGNLVLSHPECFGLEPLQEFRESP